MMREAQAAPSYTRSVSVDWWHRCSRSILVRVLDDGHEVDSFQTSSPETLRAALRPIYRHLPRGTARLQLVGIEDRRLPLGLKKSRREVQVGSLLSALTFLAG